jgi:hypothetical protein
MVAYHTNKISGADQQRSKQCKVQQQAPTGSQSLPANENLAKGKAGCLRDKRAALLARRIQVLH